METITSVNNELVKNTLKFQQKKHRDAENKFLLEGKKSIEEALNNGIEIDYIFVNSDKIQDYSFYKGRLIQTNEAVLKKISTTDSAPDAVGIGSQKRCNISDFKDLKKVVLLENIKDLGNLGTIIRSAVAFNIDGIILYGDCADLYNPKCVRSAVGNLWKIPVLKLKNITELQTLFKDYQRVATLPLADKYLNDFNPSDKILIMFGSEADGLSKELIDFSTEAVKIEMSAKVESLNLAVSCVLIMYKIM